MAQQGTMQAARTRLLSQLDAAALELTDDQSKSDLVIALFSVGMAVAFCDGHVADSELAEINTFVSDAGSSGMPPHLKGRITRLRNRPPSFEAAMKQVAKVDSSLWDLFDVVIELVTGADGVIHKEEIRLQKAWEAWRDAQR
jgi:prepilin-type processing-associated H-X9-DG protein